MCVSFLRMRRAGLHPTRIRKGRHKMLDKWVWCLRDCPSKPAESPGQTVRCPGGTELGTCAQSQSLPAETSYLGQKPRLGGELHPHPYCSFPPASYSTSASSFSVAPLKLTSYMCAGSYRRSEPTAWVCIKSGRRRAEGIHENGWRRG